MLLHVVAFLSHLSACGRSWARQWGRHLQAGTQGKEGRWCVKRCPDEMLMVGIPGRQSESLWLTAQDSDSAGFQETFAMGLLCDFRKII